MHWTHFTSKWFELWGRYRGVWNHSDTEMYCKDSEEHWDYKGAIGRGYSGHLVTFILSRFCTHWQQETLFVSCQTLSKVVICYYCHLCTKICDHTHTHTHTQIIKLRTFSVILRFSWQTNTWHWMLLTTQHNICVCARACIRNMRTSESDKRRLQAHSWQSASTSFHIIQCKHRMKYENKISWAQTKSCPSYFKLWIVHTRQKFLTSRYIHDQRIQLRKSALFTRGPFEYHFKCG